ncbi:hypothetical protein ACLK19_11025 [Escherichia coli]
MLAGKYLIDERMKKRRAEATAERALPNGEIGNVYEQSKTPGDPHSRRESNPHPDHRA